MKKVMVILSPGFEEGEAVEIIDILRRAEFKCDAVSISGEMVTGSNNITIKADRVLGHDIEEFEDYDMMVLPGGWSGTDNMLSEGRVLELVRYYNAHNRFVVAMCAAPNVLAKAGIIEGRTITAYPGPKTEPFYKMADYVTDLIACDGNLITGKGPAAALPFAFALVDALGGDSAFIKERLLYSEMKEYPDGD